jgi:RNA polymerase sigma factor (sigma-70 family)
MSTLEFYDALTGLEGYLRSFAMTYTRNEEDAKDLTQETMLKAITYKDYYTPKTNFKAWVFTIMRNIFINQYRRKMKSNTIFDHSKEMFLLSNAPGNGFSPENHVDGLELDKQLHKLEDEYLVPFQMHFQGFKYKEIAEKLDIPIGTVKSRIFLARKKLMELLPGYSMQ